MQLFNETLGQDVEQRMRKVARLKNRIGAPTLKTREDRLCSGF
jgi:hypothetical protein